MLLIFRLLQYAYFCKMNILVLGSGGREHVFATKISRSPLCENLYVAPGNAGTSECAQNVNISPTDFDALGQFCIENHIDLVLPGNEDPLVAGVVDYFKNNEHLKHIPVIGPSKKGAQLEGSKDFSKAFMAKFNIPTAAYCTVTLNNINDGISFLKTLNPPYVLKADGLAAGKGVLIENDLNKAIEDLKEILHGKFGKAGDKVVIEEFLHGIELSCFVLTDGESYKILPEAKDYKRIGEGDTGLNTGGMGAISPVPFANQAFLDKVENQIIIPTINGLKQEQIDYIGFIFIGLMNVDGEPKVIEYNCRMGDPETEVVIHRIESDFLEVLNSVSQKKLSSFEMKINPATAATVFLVSGGYPESFGKGYEITGIKAIKDSQVYQAGTVLKDEKILTNGGRVLAITSFGENITEAVQKSMQAAKVIDFQNKYYRTDIGKDLIPYEQV
jgi:phosphoribosylamine--glycine ligase